MEECREDEAVFSGGRTRGKMKREDERADVSEVIEARGHPGRKSHESRASGREQCQAALLLPHPPPQPSSLSYPLLLVASPLLHSLSLSLFLLLTRSCFHCRSRFCLFHRGTVRSLNGKTANPIAIGIAPRASSLYLLDLIRTAD